MKRHSIKIDYPLLIVVVLLVFIGAMAVFSASYYELVVVKRQSSYDYFIDTIIFAALGYASLLFFSFFPYEHTKKNILISLLVAITLALSIYVIFGGEESGGAKRWIRYGSVTIMPMEFTKVCLIFVIAWFRDKFADSFSDLKSYLIITITAAVIIGITVFQTDLASLILLITIFMLLMFILGSKIKHLLVASGIGLSAVLILLFIKNFRVGRIETWISTLFTSNYVLNDANRQIMNSIYAISSGGLFGKGMGMSEFSKLRLSQSYNDFIFAIIVEEFGMLGAFVLLTLLAFMIYRIFKIAMECDNLYGFTIAAGTGILFLLQVLVNVGVSLAILPVTGITLPFISKGGNSLILSLALVGVVLNISSANNELKSVYEVKKKGQI